MTFSPLEKVQPLLTLMVKFRESLVSMDRASMSVALPVLGSYFFRPRKIMSRTLPPCTSLVLAGSSGFCGSPQEELSTAPPVPPPLEPPPPQPVAARASAIAHTAPRACVTPRMACLLRDVDPLLANIVI